LQDFFEGDAADRSILNRSYRNSVLGEIYKGSCLASLDWLLIMFDEHCSLFEISPQKSSFQLRQLPRETLFVHIFCPFLLQKPANVCIRIEKQLRETFCRKKQLCPNENFSFSSFE
jgi:hypothetical protein